MKRWSYRQRMVFKASCIWRHQTINLHSKLGIDQDMSLWECYFNRVPQYSFSNRRLTIIRCVWVLPTLCLKNYKLDSSKFNRNTRDRFCWRQAEEYCFTEEYCRHAYLVDQHKLVNCKEHALFPNGFNLKLHTGVNMLLMFWAGSRGEITQAVKHSGKSSNDCINQCNPDATGNKWL